MITTTEELASLHIGAVVSLDRGDERVNVALKTNNDEWGLAGITKPITTGRLFETAVNRDGFALYLLMAAA